MKLVSNTGGRIVFLLSENEYGTILRLLAMQGNLPQSPKGLSKNLGDPRTRSAQEDLQEAMGDHRRDLYKAVETLLKDESRCVPGPKTRTLPLEPRHVEMLLQAVNGIRVGAWERMGSPDFEAGAKPDDTPLAEACLAIIQVTDLLLAQLLRSLEPVTE